jgi:hypothetical protein
LVDDFLTFFGIGAGNSVSFDIGKGDFEAIMISIAIRHLSIDIVSKAHPCGIICCILDNILGLGGKSESTIAT